MSKSLAIVVMGGLIPSTLHILIVVSIIFELIEVWLREERKTGASPYPSNSITFWEDVTLIIDLIVANLVIPGLLSLWIWKSQGSSLVGTVTCLLTTMSYFIFYWLGDSYKALTIFGLIWMPFIIFASYRLIKKTYGSPVFPH